MENLPYGNRRFYDIPNYPKSSEEKNHSHTNSLLLYINNNVIGKNKEFLGPFGTRKTVYCDYTASGRSLHFIEDFIREHVLPVYGNTHTTTTLTSLQTTLFRHEARDIVRNAVNASEHDALIFTGSGCTGAIHKLTKALDLTTPPIVFCGPYEHHSNLLPWRELGSEVVNISETPEGKVDLKHLEHELKVWQSSGRPMIGCFAAASNITGTLVDVNQVTATLHRYGALAFWDYATAGPYVNIDMNPVVTNQDQKYVYKDAVFLSTHKFVGGVQTPGILVAKKKLFKNPVPSGCGGGSVFFVRRDAHRYLQETEMREEGGTPAIVESVRAGLVFQLKEAVGTETIMKREHELCNKAIKFFKEVANLVVLGPTDIPRLPIFSFMIKHPETGLFLHYNFICALLNDMFGIQARGGCACAGPYGQVLSTPITDKSPKKVCLTDGKNDALLTLWPPHNNMNIQEGQTVLAYDVRTTMPPYTGNLDTSTGSLIEELLGISDSLAVEIEDLLLEDGRLDRVHLRRYREYSEKEILRPGFARLNLPFFMDDDYVQFVLEAVKLVAEQGWKMLPQYNYNPETGEWRHRTHQVFTDRKWLGYVSYKEGFMTYEIPKYQSKGPPPDTLQDCLDAAAKLFEQTNKIKVHISDQTVMFDGKADSLRWFLLPSEAYTWLQNPKVALMKGPKKVPFQPTEYPKTNYSTCNWSSCSCEHMEMSSDCRVHAKNIQPIHNSSEVNGLSDIENTQQMPLTNFKDGFMKHLQSNYIGSNETGGDFSKMKENSSRETNIDNITAGNLNSITKGSNMSQDQVDMVNTSLYSQEHVSSILANVSNNSDTDKNTPTSSEDNNSSSTQNMYCNDQISDMSCDISGINIGDPKNTSCISEEKSESSSAELRQNCASGKCCLRKDQSTSENSPVACEKVKPKWHPPPKHILKQSCEAIDEYRMIQDGDKVLVCLSGGKDSLSLLHVLRQFQFVVGKRGIHFDLGAVTIDPKTESYDPSPLKPYLAELGVPYFYEEQSIMEAAKSLPYECASICSFCSRMKRGRIYTAARREGYNVLALGQHLDDLAESFLMSLFHNGVTRTMKACYTVAEGDLKVIRPFVYVREKDLRTFAEEKQLPVIPENCPACFEAPKERHRMKQLLAAQEILHPRLFHSLKAGLKPIMAINKTGVNVSSLLANMSRESSPEENKKTERE